jgi:repressor LexA
VIQFLDALEGAGIIKRGPGARNIRIVDVTPSLGTPDRTTTVPVPIVGHVAAGLPILAEENIEQYLSVSTRLAGPPHKYFLLRVHGDSMNRAGINDGDLALVRQQFHADSGDRVVALIDDQATVKRFRPGSDAVILEPVSSNPVHRPIVVDHEFLIQGVVVATITDSR